MTLQSHRPCRPARSTRRKAASIMPPSMPRAATSTWRTPPTTPSMCSIRASQKYLFSDSRPARRRRRAGERRGRARLLVEPGENTIGVFAPGPDPDGDARSTVGVRPNGLAYDPAPEARAGRQCRRSRRCPARYTLSMVDLDAARRARTDRGAGPHALDGVRSRRRGLLRQHRCSPSQIVVVDARQPDRIARTMPCPGRAARPRLRSGAPRRLFCACDAGVLVTLDARSGKVLDDGKP